MTLATAADSLAPYIPRIARGWLAQKPEASHQRVHGTLAFVDVSGFTALTERLAARGKVGAEEITDVIGGVFDQLLAVGIAYGADLLKWGGDASLLFFPGVDSAPRACRAAMLMSDTMRRAGRVKTSAGWVSLGVSIGAHTGAFDFYLLGDRHRELIVTGPAASVTARMETIAEAGEVVVSEMTAANLASGVVGVSKEEGLLIAQVPDASPSPIEEDVPTPSVDFGSLLAADTRAHLLAGGDHAQHRQAGIAFLHYTGVDSLTEEQGPAQVADALLPIITSAQIAAEANEVNFHATDIAPDGGKIILLGGVPTVRGNDTERVIRAAHSVVTAVDPDSPIKVRAGVNAGRLFVFPHIFNPSRRIWSITGDAVNLAARVMGRASNGEVVVTEATLGRTRNPFESRPLAPFMVKGKSEPVIASVVVGLRESIVEEVDEQFPFAGREAELAELLNRAATAAEGAGQIVDIIGPAGIGKSRLVSEAIDRWSLSTIRVACEEYGSATPYRSFRRVLRVLLGLRDDSPHDVTVGELRRAVSERTPDLMPFLPLIAAVVDVPVATTPEVEDLEDRFRRARLEESVVGFLRTFLTGPSALIFEDAYALDEASASLLSKVAAAVEELPVLILLTRSADSRATLDRGNTPYLALPLSNLPDEVAAGLIDDRAGASVPPAQLASIVERAGGNPLFLQELLRTAAKDPTAFDELPDAIEPLLVAEIDRLPAKDREVVCAAAVLGSHFETALLAELLQLGTSVSDDTWTRLNAFLTPTARGWRFSHRLMRDAAYEGLSFRRRKELHGRAAAAIEMRSPAPEEEAELLSMHWLHAERYEAAWRYSRLAGDRARGLWANADAATSYKRALEAARYLKPPRQEVASVAESLGDVSELSASYQEAHRAYLHARRLCDEESDRVRLLRKLGVLHERQGNYQQALSTFTRGRRVLTDRADRQARTERSELNLASAGIRSRQARYHDCIRFAREAGAEAEAAHHRSGLAHALYLEHNMWVYLGDYSEDLATRALDIYEELGDLVGQANVLNNLGVAAYFAGRWEESARYYRRSGDARTRTGDIIGAATEDNNIGEILSDQGRFEEARQLFRSARSTWKAAGYRVGYGLATSNLGRLEARSGETSKAVPLLDEALSEFQAIKSPMFLVEARLRAAELDVLSGSFDAAIEALQALLCDTRGRQGLEQVDISALRLLGTAKSIVGAGSGDWHSFEEGGRALDEAIDRADRSGAMYELAVGLSSRVALRQLANNAGGDEVSEGDVDALIDHSRASETFERLGVRRVAITWAPVLRGGPIVAEPVGSA